MNIYTLELSENQIEQMNKKINQLKKILSKVFENYGDKELAEEVLLCTDWEIIMRALTDSIELNKKEADQL